MDFKTPRDIITKFVKPSVSRQILFGLVVTLISLGGGIFLSPLAIQMLQIPVQNLDPEPDPIPITNTTVPIMSPKNTTFIFHNAMESPYRAEIKNFSLYNINRPADSLSDEPLRKIIV